MHSVNLRVVVFGSFLFFTFARNTYTQNSAKELTLQEKRERVKVANFADSFLKNYYKTFDLTKVPGSFFVSDYKKRNTYSFYIDEYDGLLSGDERFQNCFMFLDLLPLAIVTKLEEAQFDAAKVFTNDSDNENSYFSKVMLKLFEKHRKAKLFLHKSDFSKIENVADFRDAINYFRILMAELRSSVSLGTKKKYSKYVSQNDKAYFNFGHSFECSGERCEGFPEKTKLTYFRTFPFDLLITEINGKYKVIRVSPVSD